MFNRCRVAAVLTPAVLAFHLAAAAAAAAAPIPLTRVIGTGDAAPDLPGLTIGEIAWGDFQFDGDGRLAVRATLAGAGTSAANNRALFAGPLGAPSVVIRHGGAAPLFAGSTFDFSGGNFVMNESGQIALSGVLQGDTSGTIQYLRTGGAWAVLSRAFTAAPDTTSQYDAFYSPLVLNDVGEVSFKARLAPGMAYPYDALFTGTPGNVRLIGESGGTLTGHVSLGPLGGILSYGNFADGGVGFSTSAGGSAVAVVGRPGNLTVVSRGGTQANGLPEGIRFGTTIPLPPSVNSAGNVAFSAVLTNAPPGGPTRALYFGPANDPQPALTNTSPVAAVAGATFSGFSQPILTENGNAIFFAHFAGAGITAANNQGLFVGEDPANATLVARKGAQAPGRPAGAVFTEFEGPGMGGSGRFVYNDLDQLAFAAYDTTGSGVWATHPDGTLDLVAHSGDTIAVDGVDKTIYNVWLAGHQYRGSGSCFADDGRLAVHLIFTDDTSAIYVATVPEPAGAAVVAAAAAMTWVGRRRGRGCRRGRGRGDDAAASQCNGRPGRARVV